MKQNLWKFQENTESNTVMIKKTRCYIGAMKRKKIKGKIKQHKTDIHNSREKTAIAKIALNKNNNIN